MSKRWEPIRLMGVGECHNMRQGVMGNASIFARELGDALDLAKTNYSRPYSFIHMFTDRSNVNVVL